MKSSADVQSQLAIDECNIRLVDPERVATVNARMPSEQDVVDTADVFGLLGDPRRLKLLVALLDGELCVCDLAAVTGMSESATSHALRLLRAHRVVSVRRDGRMHYYRLDDAHVRILLDRAVAPTEHTDAIHPERDGGSQ